MNNELNDDCKELDAELAALTDDYLSEKIDDDSFFILGNLNRIKMRLLPYHNELNDHIGLIIGLVSAKRLTPKEKQQVKANLKKIREIMNDLESSGTEKEKAIDVAAEKIEDTLFEIVTLLKDTNGV